MHVLSGEYRRRVRDGVLYSPSLQREKAYRVLLPDERRIARGRLPVLYLLHGYECNHATWDGTHLRHYARGLPMLIVLPDGENSWYVNSATIAKNRFEDYLVRDVVSEVDRRYRTIADRCGRAIAGMSIGGYGAIRLGLKYPELFSFAGSLGGTLAPDTLWHPRRAEVFGSPERVQRDGNCLFSLLEAVEPSLSPTFYLACGAEDWWLDANRAFTERLALRKLAYEYHETPGGHTWEYWDQALLAMLLAIARTISPALNQTPGPPPRAFSWLRQFLRGRSADADSPG